MTTRTAGTENCIALEAALNGLAISPADRRRADQDASRLDAKR